MTKSEKITLETSNLIIFQSKLSAEYLRGPYVPPGDSQATNLRSHFWRTDRMFVLR